MSLYAIGDLHLSLSVNNPMDVFGGPWENYVEKIKIGFSCVTPDDTVILLGDLSWGLDFAQAKEDMLFIDRLPGKKLLVKGNHDYWWSTVGKMERQLAECGISTIKFLHNLSYSCDGKALCGTRGWFYDEDKTTGHDEKVFNRELGRLRASLTHGASRNVDECICFLHYPPLYEGYRCDKIIDLLNEFNVKRCVYAHLHDRARDRAIEGMYKGIEYTLVSADHVDFTPVKIL